MDRYDKYGGRYHWLLLEIDKRIYTRYDLSYDYYEHNYVFYRRNKTKPASIIIVVRTNPRTYRLIYHNFTSKECFYLSFPSARTCARWINGFIFNEQKEEDSAVKRIKQISFFSKRLKFMLKFHRKTQSELARYLNRSQQTVSRWVKGEYLPPTDVIEKIAEYFGEEISEFLK